MLFRLKIQLQLYALMFKRFLIIISFAAFTTACSSNTYYAQAGIYTETDNAQSSNLITDLGEVKTKASRQHIKTNRPQSDVLINDKQLAQVYNEWGGTRYRMGGSSKRGIDCSAFVQTAFSDAFGMSLPRSTAEQRYLGRKINRNELRKGDLVFFRGNKHVGVYVGNNKFMHASTSIGVTISSLDDDYWSRHYTQSRRVM